MPLAQLILFLEAAGALKIVEEGLLGGEVILPLSEGDFYVDINGQRQEAEEDADYYSDGIGVEVRELVADEAEEDDGVKVAHELIRGVGGQLLEAVVEGVLDLEDLEHLVAGLDVVLGNLAEEVPV